MTEEREKITLKKETLTLRGMKKTMRDYSRYPVVNLDTWRKGRGALVILKEKLNKEGTTK